MASKRYVRRSSPLQAGSRHLSTRTVDGLCATMWMDRVYTDYEGAQSNCLRIRRGKNRCVKGLEREP